jgi:hypothetical protein
MLLYFIEIRKNSFMEIICSLLNYCLREVHVFDRSNNSTNIVRFFVKTSRYITCAALIGRSCKLALSRSFVLFVHLNGSFLQVFMQSAL